MSRGLCRNYLSFFLAFWYEALGSGRVRTAPPLAGARGRGSQGRDARPARRGSLDGLGVLWCQPPLPPNPRQGVLGRLFSLGRQSVGAGTAVTSPLPENWASRPWGSAAGHSSVP